MALDLKANQTNRKQTEITTNLITEAWHIFVFSVGMVDKRFFSFSDIVGGYGYEQRTCVLREHVGKLRGMCQVAAGN